MFTRYSFAISSATFMTLALLYVMETLITMQPIVVGEERPRTPVIFRKINLHQPPPPPPQQEFHKEDLTKSPVPPTRVMSRTTTERVVVGRPDFSLPNGPIIQPTPDFSDGALVNTMRASPIYPITALRDEKEGYAIVEFDVTAEGQVVNVSVVEASDRVFHRPSVDAALRFRFKPRVVDGVAVASEGVRNLFRYEIEGD